MKTNRPMVVGAMACSGFVFKSLDLEKAREKKGWRERVRERETERESERSVQLYSLCALIYLYLSLSLSLSHCPS